MEEDKVDWTPQEPAEQWVECSTDTGETYFSNVITGETSWTNPSSNSEYPEYPGIWTGKGEETSAVRDDNTIGEVVGSLLEAAINHEDPAVNEAGEVVQWLELYDEEQQVLYYFSPESGQVRWETPLEPTAVIRHCDSDSVLKTVVALQSAVRSQQARARVAAIRLERAKEQYPEVSSNDHAEEDAELDDSNSTITMTEDSVPVNEDSPWVEVYDPATQQQYYYSPRTSETSWAPPETINSSLEERKNAAATSIQSLSRRRRARKQVRETRVQLPEQQREETDDSSSLEQVEAKFEALCRREMNHEELLQLDRGDRFWGLDIFEQELIQRRLEEEIIARTERLKGFGVSTHQQLTVVASAQLDFLEFEDEIMDTERLLREQQEEHDARLAMSAEEAQQCHNGDCFWGIQAEEANQRAANVAMAQEEAASNRFAFDVLQQALSDTWEAEVQQNAAKELATRGGLEQRMQAKYLRWFYHQCISVDELLDFRWPVRQQHGSMEEFPSPSKKRRHQVHQSHFNAVASATPYPLDDLIVRERLEHGDLRYGLHSILTVHHQSARGTNGTRYEIVKAPPECAFDEATAAAIVNDSTLPENSVEEDVFGNVEHSDDRSLYGSQGSSVNYRRSRTPDPHIPARFNGVPYKQNQVMMSPTPEILSGDHRKLNQLPSLTKGKHSVDISKIRRLQKAKTKAREHVRKLSIPGQQLSNNKSHSDSAREREVDQDPGQLEDGPRAQFKRQEYDVLSKLFALMDLDASGTVNQNEMRWALQRDAEIHALAKTSSLLRLLLKQRTRLEALFTSHEIEELPVPSTSLDVASGSSNELTWDEFFARCEDAYLQLMSEGVILPNAVVSSTSTENNANTKEPHVNSRSNNHSGPSARETEAQTIRRVFALLDNDGNGILDVAEVQRTLYNTATATRRSASRPDSASKELRTLVEGSKALQPMLHQELFMTAFTKFEPMDPRGISEEEFVAFCLEIASVAAANNMVSVG